MDKGKGKAKVELVSEAEKSKGDAAKENLPW